MPRKRRNLKESTSLPSDSRRFQGLAVALENRQDFSLSDVDSGRFFESLRHFTNNNCISASVFLTFLNSSMRSVDQGIDKNTG